MSLPVCRLDAASLIAFAVGGFVMEIYAVVTDRASLCSTRSEHKWARANISENELVDYLGIVCLDIQHEIPLGAV